MVHEKTKKLTLQGDGPIKPYDRNIREWWTRTSRPAVIYTTIAIEVDPTDYVKPATAVIRSRFAGKKVLVETSRERVSKAIRLASAYSRVSAGGGKIDVDLVDIDGAVGDITRFGMIAGRTMRDVIIYQLIAIYGWVER